MGLFRRLAAYVTSKHPEWVRPEVGDLLESAPDSMVIVNAGGKMVVVNSQTEILFGYSRQELIGQPVEILIPARLERLHVKHRASFLAEPHVRPMGAGQELLGKRKNGTEFPVEISLSPLRTPQGLFVTSAVRDITERKHAETQCGARGSAAAGRTPGSDRRTGDKYGSRDRKRAGHVGKVALAA